MRGHDDMTSLSLYFKAVGKVPLLTAEEEKALFRRLRSGDTSARRHIAEANQRLVVKFARAHANRGLPLSDLIGEGNIGLLRAIDKFDPGRGCRFATYAVYWIRQCITRAIQEKAHTVRPPVDLTARVGKYWRTVAELREKLGNEPAVKDIARAMRLSAEKIGRLAKAAQAVGGTMALQENENTDEVLGTGVAVESWQTTTHRMEARDMVEVFMQAITPREREVLNLRYGLDGRRPMTLAEVSQRYNVTRSRIGQIEGRAMAKLQARALEEAVL